MAVKHTIRNSDGEYVDVDLTPVKAIKAFCSECMGHQPHLVKDCSDPHCPVYPFRMGKNPGRSGIGGKNGK